MSARAEFFLGVIAVATLATAIVQVGVLVAAGLLVRRLQRLVDRIDQELKPVFESVQAIARDAARASSLAAAQVERLDQAMTDVIGRLDRTLNAIQGFISGPLTEGTSWLTAARALFTMIRDIRSGRRGARGDEEDALFI